MCGICGLYHYRGGEPADPALLAKMTSTMIHRGPDDSGQHVDGSAGIGMRRLSIIDLAGGAQPMSNEDGRVWVVCNGEIYNFKDLRRELEARGHRVPHPVRHRGHRSRLRRVGFRRASSA